MAKLITPQLGLLEDDIAYRMALLCVNILQPLKARYPNMVVVSGFRQTNTGIGQHELGEAVDIQIRNQSVTGLYEVADYIRKNLPFDQLILNFSNIGNREPWIHVSFSPESLRGQVLTKDFADQFHEGLFVVDPLTGEAAAEALRKQGELNKQILRELENIQARQTKLGQRPVVVVPDGPRFGGPPGKEGPKRPPEYQALVACVANAMQPHIGNLGETGAFEIVKRVAWLLKEEGCGLLIKKGGEKIVPWNGYMFSAQRVCYPSGQIYDIIGATGTKNSPRFANDGFVDPNRYVAAMDPGTDFTMEWTVCPVPPPNPPNDPVDPDRLN